jgi:hypothetical protein
MAHSLMLMIKRNAVGELEAANEASATRRLHRRKRLQHQGTLKITVGVGFTSLKVLGAGSDAKKGKKRVRVEAGEHSQRRCRRRGEAGNNARTFRKEVEVVYEEIGL